jgi:hypothetical protein
MGSEIELVRTGYAAVLAGIEVITRDIDITPQPIASTCSDSRTLSTSCAAIRAPNSRPVALPADPRLLARSEILNLTTDARELDITNRPNGQRATKTSGVVPTASCSA